MEYNDLLQQNMDIFKRRAKVWRSFCDEVLQKNAQNRMDGYSN